MPGAWSQWTLWSSLMDTTVCGGLDRWMGLYGAGPRLDISGQARYSLSLRACAHSSGTEADVVITKDQRKSISYWD